MKKSRQFAMQLPCAFTVFSRTCISTCTLYQHIIYKINCTLYTRMKALQEETNFKPAPKSPATCRDQQPQAVPFQGSVARQQSSSASHLLKCLAW